MHDRNHPPAALAEAVATLAALFGAPLEAADVAAVTRPADRGALAPLAALAGFTPAVEDLAARVRGAGDPQTAVSGLNRAFCLLFLGAGGRMTAAPYESVHRCGGRLFQEPAGAMAALLARRGLRVAEDFAEAPDHLTVELALLEDALRTGDAADADALLERLRRWVPDFAAACRTHDPGGFYAAAAGLLVRLLDEAGSRRAAPAAA